MLALLQLDSLMEQQANASTEQPQSKKRELSVFLFLAVVLAPILAVMVVGGYGLLVWIYQHFTGPPTY